MFTLHRTNVGDFLMKGFRMKDWYTEALARMWSRNRGWTIGYARLTGHFVDNYGNMVRVYEADEHGICHIM